MRERRVLREETSWRVTGGVVVPLYFFLVRVVFMLFQRASPTRN